MATRFSVDFNELMEHDLSMRSQLDSRVDLDGVPVTLVRGLQVELQEKNLSDDSVHEMYLPEES